MCTQAASILERVQGNPWEGLMDWCISISKHISMEKSLFVKGSPWNSSLWKQLAYIRHLAAIGLICDMFKHDKRVRPGEKIGWWMPNVLCDWFSCKIWSLFDEVPCQSQQKFMRWGKPWGSMRKFILARSRDRARYGSVAPGHSGPSTCSAWITHRSFWDWIFFPSSSFTCSMQQE